MESFDVIVCGSGPAGLSAALTASEHGAKVLLLERMTRLGVKLLASGNGRCNLTNVLPEKEFMARFGRNGRFMSNALHFAPRDRFLEFLSEHGVPACTADGFHYFPKSGKAADILNVFLSHLRRNGVEIRTGVCLERLRIEGGQIVGGLANRMEIICKNMVLACGGCAMPGLGGSELGLRLAETAGHQIMPPFPAMAPLLLKRHPFRELSGTVLPHAALSFGKGNGRYEAVGELLFTHDGLSGPCAIDLSGDAAQAWKDHSGKLNLTLRFDAALDAGAWSSLLDEWRRKEPKRFLRTLIGWKYTHALGDCICRMADLYETKLCELSRVQKEKISVLLSGMELELSAPASFSRAMAMKGGVSLKEVDPKTMESRIVKGLFFAGELLDLTGPCGGYNIQFAFSSGCLAGFSAAAQA